MAENLHNFVRVPTTATLRKYGLSLSEWSDMVARQGGVCFICLRLPESGRLCIDHYHAKGFKRMEANERKQHVRGLLCNWCNYRILRRGVTVEKLRRAVQYLEEHDARAPRRRVA